MTEEAHLEFEFFPAEHALSGELDSTTVTTSYIFAPQETIIEFPVILIIRYCRYRDNNKEIFCEEYFPIAMETSHYGVNYVLPTIIKYNTNGDHPEYYKGRILNPEEDNYEWVVKNGEDELLIIDNRLMAKNIYKPLNSIPYMIL